MRGKAGITKLVDRMKGDQESQDREREREKEREREREDNLAGKLAHDGGRLDAREA